LHASSANIIALKRGNHTDKKLKAVTP
jgi:hypothetical protein